MHFPGSSMALFLCVFSVIPAYRSGASLSLLLLLLLFTVAGSSWDGHVALDC